MEVIGTRDRDKGMWKITETIGGQPFAWQGQPEGTLEDAWKYVADVVGKIRVGMSTSGRAWKSGIERTGETEAVVMYYSDATSEYGAALELATITIAESE